LEDGGIVIFGDGTDPLCHVKMLADKFAFAAKCAHVSIDIAAECAAECAFADLP